MHTIFWLEHLKGSDNSEDLGVDGKIILEWIFGKVWEDMDWIHLARVRDQWRVLVNTVMNIRFP
jgi:hypothetical protein